MPQSRYLEWCEMKVGEAALKSRQFRVNNWFSHVCSRIKRRAKVKRMEFNLTPQKLEELWSGNCPVCVVEMKRHNHTLSSDSASLDRFDNNLGCTEDNVVFVCWQCNNVKRHCTVEQLKVIADGFQRLQEKRSNV